MKEVRVQAVVDYTKCTGCDTCVHVCPTMAYTPPIERPIEREMHPPCNVACPVGNDIEGFVQLIQQGKWDAALNLLRDTNPLPGITGRVCESPCQKACNRGRFDQSVSIKALERALSDYASDRHKKAFAVSPKRKERIAIVGSGPAGLSCAYHLTRNGFTVTVFDERAEIGGILRYGIPRYRIPRDVLDREVGFIQKLGIDFKLNRKWGDDLSTTDLAHYDAIYLAIGCHKTEELGLPGEDCPQVIPGLVFLEQINAGKPPELGRHVLIIAGGNLAVHAARSALRLGAKPTLVFNRREKDMVAISSQIKELRSERIEILPLTMPVKFIVQDGRLTGVTCARLEMVKEETNARWHPTTVSGSEFTVTADTVINAMGQRGDLEGAPLELKVEGDKIVTDRWGRTSIPKIFAGGDIATGRGTVAHAIGSGRRGAQAIAAYLLGDSSIERPPKKRVVSAAEMNMDYWTPMPRLVSPRITVEQAISGFEEIQQAASKEAYVSETKRCLHCGVAPEFHQEDCRGCTNCSSRCPHMAISLKELASPYTVKVEVADDMKEQVREICIRANLHPESIVCFCTSTRAMEIAAAILKGARSPEDVSQLTGARTGCGVLCIEPIFRLILAGGLELGTPPQSGLWYPTVPMLWEIPTTLKEKYEHRGFRFEEDKVYYEKLISDEKVCNWGKQSEQH